MRPEGLLSLLDVPLNFPNAWLALKWPAYACRSQPANSEFKNGEAWKWSYSYWAMAWTVQVGCIECVWSGLGQNARVEIVMEVNLQNLPYFCKNLVFWCFGGFENLLARVSGLRQCVKLVWNDNKLCSYQMEELWSFCTLACFWSKRWVDNAKACTG